jgi:hypothetical protein
MEQILGFAIGVGAVAFVWVVAVAFKAANRLNEVEGLLKDLEQAYDIMDRRIDERDQLTNRRIDQEIDRVDQIYRECISHTDSRLDKLEAKITKDKQLIKG